MIKEWEKELKKQNKWNIAIGRSTNKLNVTHLAFADDLAFLTDNEQTAVHQIEVLKECGEKVGLQISFLKTEFIATKKIKAQN